MLRPFGNDAVQLQTTRRRQTRTTKTISPRADFFSSSSMAQDIKLLWPIQATLCTGTLRLDSCFLSTTSRTHSTMEASCLADCYCKTVPSIPRGTCWKKKEKSPSSHHASNRPAQTLQGAFGSCTARIH